MAEDPVARILAAYPLIHHAWRRRQVRDPAGGPPVSSHQATVLGHLDRTTGLSLSELAARMGVTLATMSLLVERLVRAGLVRRQRHPGDARRILIRLTAAGARIRAAHSLLDPERVRVLLDRLTPAERAASVEGIAHLARAAQGLPPPSPDSDDTGRPARGGT